MIPEALNQGTVEPLNIVTAWIQQKNFIADDR